MNASTFTARIVAATLADMNAAVTGALGALKGPLHGGATDGTMEMLDDIGTVANVPAFVDKGFAMSRVHLYTASMSVKAAGTVPCPGILIATATKPRSR